MSWFGHVHRVTNERVVKKIIRVENDIDKISRNTKNYMGKRQKDDLRHMKINNWTKCIQVRVKCKEVVEKAKIFNQ